MVRGGVWTSESSSHRPRVGPKGAPRERAPTYRVTLPALMQEVQTFRRFGLPATVARTRWIFGSQRRLVFFFDQGTLWPKPGPFPQMSHTAATGVHFHSIAI